jgi:hypothetical protein
MSWPCGSGRSYGRIVPKGQSLKSAALTRRQNLARQCNREPQWAAAAVLGKTLFYTFLRPKMRGGRAVLISDQVEFPSRKVSASATVSDGTRCDSHHNFPLFRRMAAALEREGLREFRHSDLPLNFHPAAIIAAIISEPLFALRPNFGSPEGNFSGLLTVAGWLRQRG